MIVACAATAGSQSPAAVGTGSPSRFIPKTATYSGKPGRATMMIRALGKTGRAAVFVQRIIRGFLTRRNIAVMNAAVVVVQKWWRQMVRLTICTALPLLLWPIDDVGCMWALRS